jgi:hypothetical protein
MDLVDEEDRKIAKKGASDEEKEAGRVEKRRLVGEGSWQWFEMTPYEVSLTSEIRGDVLTGIRRSDALRLERGSRLGRLGGRSMEGRTPRGFQR